MAPTQKPKSSLHEKGESFGKRVRFGRFIRRFMVKEDSDSASQTGSPGSSRSIDGPPESAYDRQNLPEVPLDQNQGRDLWMRGYLMLKEREPELVELYENHLATRDFLTGSLTPESAKSMVEKLSQEREMKQWQINLFRKEIKVREQAEKLIKFLLVSDKVIKTALSAQPYAALAWSGVSIVLPLLLVATTELEAMLNGFNYTLGLQQYWTLCEGIYLQDASSDMQKDVIDSLIKIYSHIFEYQVRVICHLSSDQATRGLKDFLKDFTGQGSWERRKCDIKEFSDSCKSQLPDLKLEQMQNHYKSELQKMEESLEIQREIHNILAETRNQAQGFRREDSEKELLEDLASDYRTYKDVNRLRVPGTCNWFLADEKFSRWRDSEESNLLWVSAGPGCGKSVLSRSLIDEKHLSKTITTSTVCYFFFKNGDKKRESSTDALGAILHQLFTNNLNPHLINYGLDGHKKCGTTLKENLSELWDILERCADDPEAGKIICVLDALDECLESSRLQLLDKISQFYSQRSRPSQRLKFLITSRLYSDLEARFRKFSETVHLDGDDKLDIIGREIDLVIDEEISDIAPSLNAEARSQLSNRLKSMENRTYLWLHLTFDIIRGKQAAFAKMSNIQSLLGSLPSKISDAYDEILRKSEDESVAESLLQIMLAATRPLTLDEANIALTLATEESRPLSHDELDSKLWPKEVFKSTVKNLCGLFITVHDSRLFFIHQTAREFLVILHIPGGKGKETWKGRLSVPRAHGVISKICLYYLSLDGFSKSLDYDDDSDDDDDDSDDDGDDGDDTPDKRYSFLKYSAINWVLHYKSRHDQVERHSLQLAKALLDTPGRQRDIWLSIHFPSINYFSDTARNWAGLMLASFLGLTDVVDNILIQNRSDINAGGPGAYDNALQAASAEGHRETVELLLSKNAHVNAQGGVYGNALQAASYRGRREIIKLLLSKNANVNVQGGYFGNALQAASYTGHREIVELLLSKNANVNAQGGDYYGNALQAASAAGGYYGNALQAASAEGHREIVELLLSKNADVNAQGGDYYGNALQAASAEGHREIVELFLSKNADVNAQGGYYGNALTAASRKGHREVVELLRSRGAIEEI
ncbi:hypothetical protein V8E54_001319 [Elaphomyces granulatus]